MRKLKLWLAIGSLYSILEVEALIKASQAHFLEFHLLKYLNERGQVVDVYLVSR